MDTEIQTTNNTQPEEKEITYMHDGREYCLTNRKVIKKLSSKSVVYFELQPLNIKRTSPNNYNYNKWVTEKQLYPILSDDEFNQLTKTKG